MTTYDEERLAELLALLPPAPRAWVQAAQELPLARQQVDGLVARAEADAASARRCSPISKRRSTPPGSSRGPSWSSRFAAASLGDRHPGGDTSDFARTRLVPRAEDALLRLRGRGGDSGRARCEPVAMTWHARPRAGESPASQPRQRSCAGARRTRAHRCGGVRRCSGRARRLGGGPGRHVRLARALDRRRTAPSPSPRPRPTPQRWRRLQPIAACPAIAQTRSPAPLWPRAHPRRGAPRRDEPAQRSGRRLSSAPAPPSRGRPRPAARRRSAREPPDARVSLPADAACCRSCRGMAGVRHPRMGDRRLHRRGRERVHRGQRRGRWAPARRALGERRRRGAAR